MATIFSKLNGYLLPVFLGATLITTGVMLSSFSAQPAHDLIEENRLSNEETRLLELINDYRADNNLPNIKLSNSLTKVARMHAMDFENYGNPWDKKCNLHSWSANGDWEAMCYTDDHKKAELMWSKPAEITSYTSEGYEIAAKTTGLMTADLAFKLWKKSSGHNIMMINLKSWKDVKWEAIGIGIYKGYACVWFGEEQDFSDESIACVN